MPAQPPPATPPANTTTATPDQWKNGTAAQRIAADMASRISDGTWKQYQELPPAEYTASQHGVSPRTASRAGKLLLDIGIVCKDGHAWYAAQGNPES